MTDGSLLTSLSSHGGQGMTPNPRHRVAMVTSDLSRSPTMKWRRRQGVGRWPALTVMTATSTLMLTGLAPASAAQGQAPAHPRTPASARRRTPAPPASPARAPDAKRLTGGKPGGTCSVTSHRPRHRLPGARRQVQAPGGRQEHRHRGPARLGPGLARGHPHLDHRRRQHLPGRGSAVRNGAVVSRHACPTATRAAVTATPTPRSPATASTTCPGRAAAPRATYRSCRSPRRFPPGPTRTT